MAADSENGNKMGKCLQAHYVGQPKARQENLIRQRMIQRHESLFRPDIATILPPMAASRASREGELSYSCGEGNAIRISVGAPPSIHRAIAKGQRATSKFNHQYEIAIMMSLSGRTNSP